MRCGVSENGYKRFSRQQNKRATKNEEHSEELIVDNLSINLSGNEQNKVADDSDSESSHSAEENSRCSISQNELQLRFSTESLRVGQFTCPPPDLVYFFSFSTSGCAVIKTRDSLAMVPFALISYKFLCFIVI